MISSVFERPLSIVRSLDDKAFQVAEQDSPKRVGSQIALKRLCDIVWRIREELAGDLFA